MLDPTDHQQMHLLSKRQLIRSNRCGQLTRNLCLIASVLGIILCLIFKEGIERVLSESSQYISYSISKTQSCDRIVTREGEAVVPSLKADFSLTGRTENILGKVTMNYCYHVLLVFYFS